MKIIKSTTRKIRILLIVLGISFLSISTFSFVNDDFEIAKNLDIFATLYRELNLNYVDEVSPGELMKKAIDAMLESLDPYTNYYSESEIEEYTMMTTGEYGGIGAYIHKNGDYVFVSDPYEGCPAQKNDLRAGDIILEVNGKSAKGKSTSDVSAMLKGQPGTTITLLIKREGEQKNIEKTITREEIKMPNIPYSGMVDPDIGYINLSGFTKNASTEVKDAFLKLKSQQELKGLIFDLRGNGGGLLNEAVNIVNLFVEKGQVVVKTKGKIKDQNNVHMTINPPVDLNIPIVILVDRGSASASEIVTGAIQDLDRGVIMGERTYGKGLVQNVVPLSYNTKLKVTVAKYYIPSGRCIQAIDYTHRNEDGSVGKVPDSLKTAFKTKNGRVVYDGGGIEPDIASEPYEYSDISACLISKYLIFDFATQYKMKHPEIAKAKDFEVPDDLFNEFVTYLNDKEYDYTTESERNLKELKESAEKEKYFDDFKVEYEALKNKMMHNKKADLIKFKSEIKELLKEEIVSRYYFQRGRIEVALQSDELVKKAIEVLKDNNRYKSLLISNANKK
jgi:carboxyl-terminal processing protease